MAKSRVAPLKQKTLPFLELLAALLGARYCEYVTDHLPDNMTIDKFLWSDSQIVLTWISSQKPLPQRIMGKIVAIRDITSRHIWRYSPSAENPADLVTHGVSSRLLVDNTQWFHGPPWLTSPAHEWPVWDRPTNADCHDLHDDQRQLVQVNTTAASFRPSGLLGIIDLDRYTKTGSWSLSSSDLVRAKRRLIYDAQQFHYAEAIPFLSATTPTAQRTPPIIQQLGLFFADDGLIRCKGRMPISPTLPNVPSFFPRLTVSLYLLCLPLTLLCSTMVFEKHSRRWDKSSGFPRAASSSNSCFISASPVSGLKSDLSPLWYRPHFQRVVSPANTHSRWPASILLVPCSSAD